MHPPTGGDAAAAVISAPSHEDEATTIIQTASGVNADTGALLYTACAYVVNGGMRIPIRVFIDPGSTLTVITPSLRSMLRE